jgi:hypothetical protein
MAARVGGVIAGDVEASFAAAAVADSFPAGGVTFCAAAADESNADAIRRAKVAFPGLRVIGGSHGEE